MPPNTPHSSQSPVPAGGSPRPPAQVPGYEICGFLGRGAYGEVWSALDQRTGRGVAIKFFTRRSADDLKLLGREIEKLVVLSADRYVVQLLDVGLEATPPFYVMEYIEHGSLEERLAHGQVLSAADATELFKEIANGMMHLHGKGILHCDLKPGNVLLDQDGKPRLADFGQARMQGDPTASFGTLFYMAPEQADLEAVPDQRWDVYGLGAIFYAMLTGKPPYYSREFAQTLQATSDVSDRLDAYRKWLASTPPADGHRQVAGVDRSLAEIINRCIAVDPTQRFSSIQEVMFAMRQREVARARRPLVVLGLVGPLLLLSIMSLFSWYAYRQARQETEAAVFDKAVESNRFAAKLAARNASEQIDQYFRAIQSLARDPEFLADFETLMKDDEFKKLRKQLSDPNDNADDALDPLREEFIAHAIRRKLDEHLKKRIKNKFGQWPMASSWLAYDRQGNQLAARFSDEKLKNTIGKNYSYRSYFTGLDRDLIDYDADQQESYQVSADPDQRTIIHRPHLSAIFLSKATGNWKMTFSAPVRLKPDGDVVGIVGCAVEMGNFIDFEAGQGQYAMLFDYRPGDNTGVILEHPLFDRLKAKAKKAKGLPSTITRYRIENLNAIAEKHLFRDPIAEDPLGEDFDRQWIAAVEPVKRSLVTGRPTDKTASTKASADSGPASKSDVVTVNTGLYVLAAEDYEKVIHPVHQLSRQLAILEVMAALFFILITIGMWLSVLKMLRQSRQQLSVSLLRSSDSSLPQPVSSFDTHEREEAYKTIAASEIRADKS